MGEFVISQIEIKAAKNISKEKKKWKMFQSDAQKIRISFSIQLFWISTQKTSLCKGESTTLIKSQIKSITIFSKVF